MLSVLLGQVAILALGRLRAVGSVMHLKKRFGVGYRVSVHTGDGQLLRLRQYIEETLPGIANFGAVSASSLVYQIPLV